VGVALAPDHGTAVSDLLKHADLALYGAKLDGRATCRHYEPEMNARMTLRRDLEMDLRRAINTDQLEVHYQPVVTLQGERVTGCEALVRWHHPKKGMIPPATFIPVAEDTGLISAIGERVLWQACTDAAGWPDDKKIAVNVSTVQLRNPEFPRIVERCLRDTGLSPQRLELEMTESVLMQNTEATLETLRKLQETGVGISLDDFFTGYSSLSYLRCFPFNRIKIDRSFVTDIALRPDAQAIVRTILMLAESLGMTTTAEGVETDDQRTLLKAIGCHEMQGFLFSRALPPDAALRLMRDGVLKDTAAA
jgi:predicted signal transduction protein with EAL and GGDEF domain